jgi:hypothetical protein
MYARTIGFLILAASHAFAQSGLTLVGWGYSFHAPVAAPGQIMQLQVAGLKTVLSPSSQMATSVPLPTSLAGISVTVNQSVSQSIMGVPVQNSYQAPLISVNQLNLCSADISPDCMTTFIALQMPYELETNPTSPPIIQTQVVITENGVDSEAFRLGVVPDQIHVVTTCEDQPFQSGCPSIVAHADGTRVSAQSPALPNETVVIYAWGLGSTTGAPNTGDVSPTPALVVSLPGYNGVLVGFDFRPNAAPSRYFQSSVNFTLSGTVNFSTAVAYLTPGAVGLYQVNVQLPATFPAVPSCGLVVGQIVQTNLTIDIGGPYSFDGAGICVQTP